VNSGTWSTILILKIENVVVIKSGSVPMILIYCVLTPIAAGICICPEEESTVIKSVG
jgi:hypothetical protein